jgi:preprotein translocase subunit SecD
MTNRKALWIGLAVIAGAVLLVVLLPVLGLLIFFRTEIRDWVRGGPAMPTSGVRLVYVAPGDMSGDHVFQSEDVETLKVRLRSPGGRLGSVRPMGPDRLEVLVQQGADMPDRVATVKRLVGQQGRLEMRIVCDRIKDASRLDFEKILAAKKAGQTPDGAPVRWCPMKNGYPRAKSGALAEWGFVYVVDEAKKSVDVLVDLGDGADVTGKDLCRAFFDRYEGRPIVRFNMKAEAGPRFADLTREERRGRYLAIILDDVIQTSPVLRATLSDGGIIEGYNGAWEAEEVVTVLNSGSLVARWTQESEEEFGPGAPLPAEAKPEPL